MVALKVVLFTAAVSSVASQNRGTSSECIGARYHQVDYDYSDEQDENGMPGSFTVQVKPEPEYDADCPQPNGGFPTGKAICVGINTHDCQSAAEVVKINDYLDCEDCYMGLTTDLFYNITVERFRLKDVKVGIRDSHLRGSSVLHFSGSGGQQLLEGTFPITNSAVNKKISFPAGPIPVNIQLKVPMQLDYSVGLSESMDIHFGGGLDVNLGDHFISWNSEEGFGATNTDTAVTWTPTIIADGQVSAEIPLAIKTSLEVEFQNVLSWNLHMSPALQPLRAGVHTHWFSRPDLCLSGEGDFLLSHEANVHFDFLGFHRTLATFGPADIYQKHWESVFNKCIGVPRTEEQVVV